MINFLIVLLFWDSLYIYMSYDDLWLQKRNGYLWYFVCFSWENIFERQFGNDINQHLLMQLHFMLNVIMYNSWHSCCFLKQKTLRTLFSFKRQWANPDYLATSSLFIAKFLVMIRACKMFETDLFTQNDNRFCVKYTTIGSTIYISFCFFKKTIFYSKWFIYVQLGLYTLQFNS